MIDTAEAPTSVGNSASRVADENTPLVRNCWYVAALASEITRTPMQRYILGTSVVLYRTESGEAVALQDRCPHRSFPLSNGHLEGDNIVCHYHGLTFDRHGACVHAPMMKSVPRQVRIAAYQVRECGPLVWIWPGDPQQADEAPFPGDSWAGWLSDPQWVSDHIYCKLKASYVLFHENVIDLTHFTYLHPDTAGTPEWISSPYEVSSKDQTVRMVRRLENSPPPGLYARPMKLDAAQPVSKTSAVTFVSPALQVVHQTIEERGGENPRTFQTRILNIMTPETNHSTHHWNFLGRSWGLDDASASELLLRDAGKAILEDKAALEAIAELKQMEQRSGFAEASLPTDRAGMAIRRLLKEAADNERQ